jgi:hypothetical protein
MTRLRAIFFVALIGALAVAACGSTGSGGPGSPLISAAPATSAPAVGTYEPTKQYPTKPSGDPYSDSGY